MTTLVDKSLYRNLLKQINLLPNTTAQQHYTRTVKDSFRGPAVPESSSAALKRSKQARKLLRELQAANEGYLHSLTRVLDTAYARRGPQKHALLRPFTQQSPSHPRHSFPPPLAALVTSSLVHVSRAPSRAALIAPPTLPERADPSTEEARLLGPLIPQRINAIRRRYFNEQVGKLRAPLAVIVKGVEGQADEVKLLKEAGLAKVDLLRGRSMLTDLEDRASVREEEKPRPPRRLQTKEERSVKGPAPRTSAVRPDDTIKFSERTVLQNSRKTTKWHRPKVQTARFLRRRYQKLLEQSPIVTVEQVDEATAKKEKGKKDGVEGRVRFTVSRSPVAKGAVGRLAEMSEEDRWWIEQEPVGKSSKPLMRNVT